MEALFEKIYNQNLNIILYALLPQYVNSFDSLDETSCIKFSLISPLFPSRN